MKLENLDLITMARASGANYIAEIDASDLTQSAAATAQAVAIMTTDKRSLVEVVASVSTGFSDASDTAFNSTAMEIGVSGAEAALLVSQELNANAASPELEKAGAGKQAYAEGKQIIATFSSMTGKKLADIDNGKVVILLKVIKLPELTDID